MSAIDETTVNDQTEAERILQEKLGAAENPLEPEPVPDISAEDDIEKPVTHKTWKFIADYNVRMGNDMVPQHFEREYVQKPLSYHAMIEFTGLFTRNLNQAMASGLSLDKIMPDEKLPITFQDGQVRVVKQEGIEGIDSVVKALLTITSYIPDFLIESQCIWLRVPRNERALLSDIWSRPVDEGGMSLKDGEEMLSLFIEQNYEELEYFLTKWWQNLYKTAQRARTRSHQEKGH